MRTALKDARRIVIKVGSSTLTHANGRLNLYRIECLVKQMADLVNQGKEILFVSSGATAAGLPALGFKEKPRDLAVKQAAASVGQGLLLHMYEKLFREYGHTVGQVLLTREDTVKRSHYVSLKNTLMTLLELGVIPVINENDVVAIEEFKIGDNDTLSATVAGLVEADALIILSDIDGLYTDNPQTNPEATLISEVKSVTPDIYAIAGGAGSSRGTGGMLTKIQAAHIAVNSGVHMVIASGEERDSIRHVLAGEVIGTHFLPADTRTHMKKRWMAFGTRLKGVLRVDEGCRRALMSDGASLLAVGITEVEGEFEFGDTVSINYNGREIGRGISNYASDEIERIRGCHSEDIADRLGIDTAYDEVIHRDNLVVLR